jgi:hypothetical protein
VLIRKPDETENDRWKFSSLEIAIAQNLELPSMKIKTIWGRFTYIQLLILNFLWSSYMRQIQKVVSYEIQHMILPSTICEASYDACIQRMTGNNIQRKQFQKCIPGGWCRKNLLIN